MASPIFNNTFHFEETARAKCFPSKVDEGLPDSFDWSSAELTDVFEDETFEGEFWTPPTHELRQRIIAQLEYYLSDENLETDAFLLKRIQRDKLGFVSLKLLTSFKKIQALTCDWRTILAAARSSLRLEVNEAGTKVRRRAPIPDCLFSSNTNKLLAWNLLASAKFTDTEGGDATGTEPREITEMVRLMFSSHGSINSLYILYPGKEIPTEFKCYTEEHPELGRELCAVVEYEYLEGACKAYNALRAEEQAHGGTGIRVALLRNRRPENQSNLAEESEEEGIENDLPNSNRKSRKHFFSRDDSILYSSSESDFAPASPRPNRKVSRSLAQYGSPLEISHVSSFCSDPYRNPLGSPVGSPLLPRRLSFGGHSTSSLATSPISSTPTRKYCGDFAHEGTSAGRSPLLQNFSNACQVFQSVKGCHSSPSRVGVQVVRQPLGPDGTKGFYNCIRENMQPPQ